MRTVIAHESGDGISIAHCPFCGSGQVVGRSDGNAECQFCNQAFLVRVQPMYSAFPQSVDGMPVQIPGMPPPAPAGMDPGMGAPGEDGAVPPGDDGGNPFAGGGDEEEAPDGDKDDDSGDSGKPPPFAKKTYRTGAGRFLTRAAYVDYLASTLRGAP
ncbi:hypothetical protein ACFZAM_32095 [Streptomyces sp. NPDC008079]|uniref:hypothetical protein n=1 Tax=Streptomyces sp. NPDC008079 TaxID=3364806 RepID=UPI0036E97C0F